MNSEDKKCINCFYFDNYECMMLKVDFAELILSPDIFKPEVDWCSKFELKASPNQTTIPEEK